MSDGKKTTPDLSELMAQKSQLISSLYEFSKLFERIDYSRLEKEVIAQTIAAVKRLYRFENGAFVFFDDKDGSYYIRSTEIAWNIFNRVHFPVDDVLAFSHRSKNIAFKLLNPTQHGKLSEGEIKSLLYIPMYYSDDFFGLYCFESAAEHNLDTDDISILSIMASQAAFSLKNALFVETLEQNFLATINSLVTAIEVKDAYTKGHSSRVSRYSVDFAFQLGLSSSIIKGLEIASLLHDVGKIGIPFDLINKRTILDMQDRDFIRKHPVFGEQILQPLTFLGNERKIIRHHHERWDGTGYPDQLRGESIPFESRLLGITDSFDAMSSDRPYRASLTLDDIIGELLRGKGTQFDPVLTDRFVELLTSKKIEIIKKVS